jgi:hypothetical protein
MSQRMPIARTMSRALLALLLLGAAGDAEAYVRSHVDPTDDTSPCLFWGTRQVSVEPHQRGSARLGPDASIPALWKSFQTWTDVDCSDFAYVDGGTTTSITVGHNRAQLDQGFLAGDVKSDHTVIFREQLCSTAAPANDPCFESDNQDCDSIYDCWPYADEAIALTTTTYDSQTGQMFDADIELNEVDFTFSVLDPPTPPCLSPPAPQDGCISTDLQNTVTHEAGHFLGLGHSYDPEATMYASAGTGETKKRDLDSDDIQAICDIYPTGKPTLLCNEPTPAKSGCGCGTSSRSGPFELMGLWIVGLGIGALRARRPDQNERRGSARMRRSAR